jgi:hypothetical protein
MSDALPLPPHPSLQQYKKRAKELVKICKSGDPDALHAWVKVWIESLVKLYRLDISLPRDAHRAYTPAEIGYHVERAAARIGKHLNAGQRPSRRVCTLAQAQLALAREHGFASWPRFATHVAGLARARSPVSAFEAAVDAVVGGDRATLAKLLHEHPLLVRARSTRDHRSTLLHYVSANGVEDFRQKTPRNIVAITKLLLAAGADVNAESDAYGGRSTTLGLTATSYHPEVAGVQLPLLELLIEQGARIDGPDGGSGVNGCLHNRRQAAAEFLAAHGARLDLEGAAGVGRLDVVKSFFHSDGSLKPPATAEQMKAGFAWACEFGRTEVVDFLLQKGLEAGAPLHPEGGETGLHWAAFAGHTDIVRLLLEQGAPVDVKDRRHDGTPLGWALYGWGVSTGKAAQPQYYEVVALLARVGATLEPEWYEQNEDRQRAARRIQSDPRMRAALRGQHGPRVRGRSR